MSIIARLQLIWVRMWTTVVTLGFGIVLTASAQDPSAVQRLDYDHSLPLDTKELGSQARGVVTIHDISYASPKGGRVPAYLVVPRGPGPFAAILWGHWYWKNSAFRNRKEFLEEALVLAHSGIVSLLVDGPAARPGYKEDPDPLSDKGQDDLVQAIVDMRRGADLLLARKDVDSRRLAYVGHSYNATVGAFLTGLDRRFKCFVLMAGGLSDEVDMKSKEFIEFRRKFGPGKVDGFMARNAWLDPGKFISHSAPAVIFLQYGSHDEITDRARDYMKVIDGPKRLEIYDAPHALNQAALKDRIAFLCAQFNLRLPSDSEIAKIPGLPQPPDQGN